jgi:hypothetical protein
MRSRIPFATVLDGRLQPPRGFTAGIATAACGGAVFASSHRGRHVWAAVESDARHERGDRTGAGALRSAVLPEHVRMALTRLRAAGALLPEPVTGRVAKRAFRQLALACHPDRHPHASPLERARLAIHFADLRGAYETVQRELAAHAC